MADRPPIEYPFSNLPAPGGAADGLEGLLRRGLDSNPIFFAMGESIAHLHYLHHAGRLSRQTGSDGVIRYASA